MPGNPTDILIISINARYSHAALGPRYLRANLGKYRRRSEILEFVIQDNPARIAEAILSRRPRIVGFSLAIWNIGQARKAIAMLRDLAPELVIVAGGPEVRWATEIPRDLDYLVRGEGETVFRNLCGLLLDDKAEAPARGSILDGGLPNLDELALPYDEYSDEDIRQRIIYVETSRGCPFKCEFCLSSREEKVRRFNLDRLLKACGELVERGCRGFKFIDRTFNLELTSCLRLLDFFYDKWPRTTDGELIPPRSERQVALGSERGRSFFLHFEVVPDRFDHRLLESLARFPDGGIQLEMGIQSFDEETGDRISRRVNREAAGESIRNLKEQTGVHIHADLILGLPGEGIDGIAASFDALRSMEPDEIQVGILKLLPGAPIERHRDEFSMVYNRESPYDILKTDRISFDQMQHLKRLARYYDIFANSGKFASAMRLLMDEAPSAFRAFSDFSEWLWHTTGQDHAISQARQYGLLLDYLDAGCGVERDIAGKVLAADYLAIGNLRYLPEVLRPWS